MSLYKLTAIQHGRETTPGTLVPATWIYPGEGTLEFEDKVETPTYLTGVAGRTIEYAFVSQRGTTINLSDTPASVELLAYMLNIGVQQILGPGTSFNFSFPTTSANTISTFTFEYALAQQEYEFGYGFLEKFSLHGDAGADNGVVKFNGTVRGRSSIASTKTSNLTIYANHQPLIINSTSKFSIDAVGTAAGTGSHISGTLRGFSLDCETGWKPGHYADGRSDNDFSFAEGSGVDYKLTGRLRVLLNSTAVTEIANLRAGTGRIVQIALAGTSSRAARLNLPMTLTKVSPLGGTTENGLIFVEFEFDAGYSRTTTAQAPSIQLTTSSSLTIT